MRRPIYLRGSICILFQTFHDKLDNTCDYKTASHVNFSTVPAIFPELLKQVRMLVKPMVMHARLSIPKDVHVCS